MITKKHLAIKLSKLKSYSNPKVKLEQYVLNSEIAAEILWNAYLQDNIENKIIADLGCGPGILGIGALLLGAKKVYFIDIDPEAIELAKENTNNKNAIFKIQNIQDFNIKVDTILQNPPYGTKDEHADKKFLEKAFSLTKNIYTLHKITTKSFINSITKDNNFKIKGILEFNYPLKKSYDFHKKPVKNIKVGCWILNSP